MNIKLYIHKDDIDKFYKFYDNVNNDVVKQKNEIPVIDIKEHVKGVRNASTYLEVLVNYDIYQAMKFLFIEKKAELMRLEAKKTELGEIEKVDEILTEAAKHSLLSEVVLFSLKAIKENPQLSITDAIVAGKFEWIK